MTDHRGACALAALGLYGAVERGRTEGIAAGSRAERRSVAHFLAQFREDAAQEGFDPDLCVETLVAHLKENLSAHPEDLLIPDVISLVRAARTEPGRFHWTTVLTPPFGNRMGWWLTIPVLAAAAALFLWLRRPDPRLLPMGVEMVSRVEIDGRPCPSEVSTETPFACPWDPTREQLHVYFRPFPTAQTWYAYVFFVADGTLTSIRPDSEARTALSVADSRCTDEWCHLIGGELAAPEGHARLAVAFAREPLPGIEEVDDLDTLAKLVSELDSFLIHVRGSPE